MRLSETTVSVDRRVLFSERFSRNFKRLKKDLKTIHGYTVGLLSSYIIAEAIGVCWEVCLWHVGWQMHQFVSFLSKAVDDSTEIRHNFSSFYTRWWICQGNWWWSCQACFILSSYTQHPSPAFGTATAPRFEDSSLCSFPRLSEALRGNNYLADSQEEYPLV